MEERGQEDFEDQFRLMDRMLHPEKAAREDLLAKLTERELFDDEAFALKYGWVQHRIRAMRVITVKDHAVLEAQARTMYEPAAAHGTCDFDRCHMLRFSPGQKYASLQYEGVQMIASGRVFVCPKSGRPHICDGLSCPHAVRLDSTGVTQCRISGEVATPVPIVSERIDGGGNNDCDEWGDGMGIEGYDDIEKGGALDMVANGSSGPSHHAVKRRRASSRSNAGRGIVNQRHESSRWRNLCNYIETLLYGTEYMNQVIKRAQQLWRTLRSQIVTKTRGREQPNLAYMMSSFNETITSLMGSTMDPAVWHFGETFERLLEASDQATLYKAMNQAWTANRHPETSLICEYFADLVFAFWKLLTELPATPWRPSGSTQLPTSLMQTVFTLLQMTRDGLCFSVVYNKNTRLVAPCIRPMNNVGAVQGQGVCGCQKRMGFGAVDCRLKDSHLWTPGDDATTTTTTTVSSDNNDGMRRLDKNAVEKAGGLDNLYVQELWIVPSHSFLRGLPSDDMAPSLHIESNFHNAASFNARGQIQGAFGALFDQRNPNLETTTIEDLEKFCIHRRFDINRLVGCQQQRTPTEE